MQEYGKEDPGVRGGRAVLESAVSSMGPCLEYLVPRYGATLGSSGNISELRAT